LGSARPEHRNQTGTAFNWVANRTAYITPDRPDRFWFQTYSDSARRFKEITAQAGADVLISNHTIFDGSKTKLSALERRKPGDPHPYREGEGPRTAVPLTPRRA